MQIFAVDFSPIFGANVGGVGRVGLVGQVGQVGQVGLVGRRAIARRTPGGKLNCTDRYGGVRMCTELPGFAPAATSARGYGGQAIGLGGELLALLAPVVRRTPVLRTK